MHSENCNTLNVFDIFAETVRFHFEDHFVCILVLLVSFNCALRGTMTSSILITILYYFYLYYDFDNGFNFEIDLEKLLSL